MPKCLTLAGSWGSLLTAIPNKCMSLPRSFIFAINSWCHYCNGGLESDENYCQVVCQLPLNESVQEMLLKLRVCCTLVCPLISHTHLYWTMATDATSSRQLWHVCIIHWSIVKFPFKCKNIDNAICWVDIHRNDGAPLSTALVWGHRSGSIDPRIQYVLAQVFTTVSLSSWPVSCGWNSLSWIWSLFFCKAGGNIGTVHMGHVHLKWWLIECWPKVGVCVGGLVAPPIPRGALVSSLLRALPYCLSLFYFFLMRLRDKLCFYRAWL